MWPEVLGTFDRLKKEGKLRFVGASINSDIKEGTARWVGSTPTFFINGKRFVGAKQLSIRGSLWIERILKK